MPPDAVSQAASHSQPSHRFLQRWRIAIGLFSFGMLALVIPTWSDWSEMVHQWWNIDTYTHILLVPPIVVWFVILKRGELSRVDPQPWLPGLAIVSAGLALWIAGRATEINLIAHAGAVGALQGLAVTVLGLRLSVILALPIGFAAFLVPFGDEIIPQLQAITARITIWLTHLSGIPAQIDGIYIDTPAGLFIVAEACSGVRFLIAMVTLAVLVCFTRFESWKRRTAFMLASIIVPIIANGIRAWGTIYVAQSYGAESAAGFDHIVYGWIFFAVVVAIILTAAWRYFEREPEDYGLTVEDVDRLALVRRYSNVEASPAIVVAGLVAIALVAGVAQAIAAPTGIG
jgi:exosortase A